MVFLIKNINGRGKISYSLVLFLIKASANLLKTMKINCNILFKIWSQWLGSSQVSHLLFLNSKLPPQKKCNNNGIYLEINMSGLN